MRLGNIIDLVNLTAGGRHSSNHGNERLVGGTDLASILARVRQGDTEAFRALVEQDAEDVVQESFLRAYQNIGRFEARSDFATWLYRIVANCSLDLMRSKQAHKNVALDENPDRARGIAATSPSPEHLAMGSEFQAHVGSALAVLGPLERAAFVLRHYEGCTIHEIACTLGVGKSAAKNSVFRAVHKLRVALASERARKL